MRWRNERGSLSVLVIGLALVTMAVMGVAVDGTRAFLFRRTLQNHADAIALAAAAELDTGAYYSSGGREVRLDRTGAGRVATDLMALRDLPAGVSLDVSQNAVGVTVRGTVPTTFLGLVGIEELPVAASAEAAPVAGERAL